MYKGLRLGRVQETGIKRAKNKRAWNQANKLLVPSKTRTTNGKRKQKTHIDFEIFQSQIHFSSPPIMSSLSNLRRRSRPMSMLLCSGLCQSRHTLSSAGASRSARSWIRVRTRRGHHMASVHPRIFLTAMMMRRVMSIGTTLVLRTRRDLLMLLIWRCRRASKRYLRGLLLGLSLML